MLRGPRTWKPCNIREVPYRWRRHTYPVQSSNTQPCKSPPPKEALTSIQVPAKIQALKESEKLQNHGRTIVVCLDGTGDKFDHDNSNIVHLVSCLKKDDKNQNTYYQAGIGTYGDHGLSTGIAATLDMAVGSLLGLHIRDAYNFLMHAYKEGDKICIFGFSRGTYTARCLAGMVHTVGLLPTRNVAQIPFAYDIYKDDSPQGREDGVSFKKTFCTNVSIHFLGLFDSVASVGFIPRELPFTTTATAKCHYIRHAMALDERRAKFKLCRFEGDNFVAPEQSQLLSTTTTLAESQGVEHVNGFANGTSFYKREALNGGAVTPGMMNEQTQPEMKAPRVAHERHHKSRKHLTTDLLEVWFAGCHCDVGGGAVRNEERHRLANIPLRWMIRQCFECDTGIIFNTKILAEMGLDVHTLWPKYSRLEEPILGPSPSLIEHYETGLPPKERRSSLLTPIQSPVKKRGFFDLNLPDCNISQESTEWVPEQLEDYFDSLQPINDMLVAKMTWWLAEVWPVTFHMFNPATHTWDARIGMNMAMARPIMGSDPIFHWTVRHRMLNMAYKHRAIMEKDAVWQVTV